MWVPEYARIYLESKSALYESIGKDTNEVCLEEDILPIVTGQLEAENKVALDTECVFFDTNPLQTKVYVSHYYHKKYDWLEDLILKQKYDFYLLTDIDIPWVSDPLRDRPDQREEMFQLFKNELDAGLLPYEIISGNFEQRIRKAIDIVTVLLNKK